jgi:hypothetical protein
MEQMTEPMMERLLAIMEKFEAKLMTKLGAYQEKMDAWLEAVKYDRKETTACPEVTEACPENAEKNPEEMKSVSGSIKKFLTKGPQSEVSEHWRTDTGTGI